MHDILVMSCQPAGVRLERAAGSCFGEDRCVAGSSLKVLGAALVCFQGSEVVWRFIWPRAGLAGVAAWERIPLKILIRVTLRSPLRPLNETDDCKSESEIVVPFAISAACSLQRSATSQSTRA